MRISIRSRSTPTIPAVFVPPRAAAFHYSESAGESWQHVNGFSRSYTVPLLVQQGAIYTAAAAGPPPTWSMG
jgi:hypothetical protein